MVVKKKMILFAMNCHSQFPSSNSFLIHQDGVKMEIKLSQSAISLQLNGVKLAVVCNLVHIMW